MYSQTTSLLNSNAMPNNIIQPFNGLINHLTYQYISRSITNNINDNINDNIPIIHEHDDTGSWMCSNCGIINNVIEKCCGIVFKWECTGCNTKNDSNLIKCTECNEIRNWECQVCDTTNTITSHTCMNCLTTNEELINWTCEECNETKALRSRFVCNSCNETRSCNCSDCIGNNLYIPFSFLELEDYTNDVDFFELDDVETNNGLTDEQISNITKLEWNEDIQIDTCIICISLFTTSDIIYKLPCNNRHCFHVDCLKLWVDKRNTCPICRSKIE